MADRKVTDQSLLITIRVLLVFVLWLHVGALDQYSHKNTKPKTIDLIPAPPFALPALGHSVLKR